MFWYEVWLRMSKNATWYNKIPCGFREAGLLVQSKDKMLPITVKVREISQ